MFRRSARVSSPTMHFTAARSIPGMWRAPRAARVVARPRPLRPASARSLTAMIGPAPFVIRRLPAAWWVCGLPSALSRRLNPPRRAIPPSRRSSHTCKVDSRDPWWVPAQLDAGSALGSVRVAMVAHAPGIAIDQAISVSIRDAARWLEDAGYRVEEVTPPRLEEAGEMFFTVVRTEEKAGTTKAIERFGDAALRRARASTMAYASELDFEGYIQ